MVDENENESSNNPTGKRPRFTGTLAERTRNKLARSGNGDRGSAGNSDTNGTDSESGNESIEPGSGDSVTENASESADRINLTITNADNGNSGSIDGSASGIGSGKRRPGRPRNVDRSSGNSGGNSEAETPTITPSRNVSFSDVSNIEIGSGKKRGRPRKIKTLEIKGFADGLQLLHLIPAAAGLGDHWTEIPDEDVLTFSEAFINAAGTSDSKIFKQILALIEKAVPWGTVAYLGYNMYNPRIQETMRLINDAKREAGKNSNVVDANFGRSEERSTTEYNLQDSVSGSTKIN